MNRRCFSQLLAAGFLGPWLGAIAGDRQEYIDLSKLALHEGAARAVGRAYLQSHPHLNVDMLVFDLGLESCPSYMPLDQVLRERIQSDFSSSRSVFVERWLFARCEAAICGLLAMGITHVPRFS